MNKQTNKQANKRRREATISATGAGWTAEATSAAILRLVSCELRRRPELLRGRHSWAEGRSWAHSSWVNAFLETVGEVLA